MIKIISSFISIAYIPLFLLACAGLFYYAKACRKKHQMRWGYFVAASILFFLLWRILMNKVLYSPRYNLIILFPVLFFAGYACSVFKKYTYVVLACFVLVNLYQTVRFNPYDSFLKKGGAAVRSDRKNLSQKDPVFLSFCGDEKRLEYYSGLDVYQLHDSGSTPVSLTALKRNLAAARECGTTMYLAFNAAGNESVSRGEIDALPSEWTEIYRSWRNRKKTRQFFIYRFIPDTNRIDKHITQNDTVPLANCGFEDVYQATPSDVQSLTKKGFSFFEEVPICLPKTWGVSGSTCALYSDFEAEATDRNPILGKRSLRLKAVRDCTVLSTGAFPVESPGVILFSLRAIADSTLAVTAQTVPKDASTPIRQIKLLELFPMAGSSMTIRCPVLPDEFGANISGIRIRITIHSGEFLVDDFRIKPMQEDSMSNEQSLSF